MFNVIFEYYKLNNYDTNPGGGVTLSPDSSLGLTVGKPRPMHIYTEYSEDDEGEDEDIDDDTLHAVSRKYNNSTHQKGRDPSRTTVSHSGGNMRQTGGLNEEHTNLVRPGISPYKTGKFTGKAIGSGGANQAFRTSGPGRKTSGPYGNSRATYPRHDEDLNPLFFGDNITSKYERSLKKHQRRIKKIKNLLKELDN